MMPASWTLEGVLSELKQIGVIDVQYRSITLVDLKGLSAIAAGDAAPAANGKLGAATRLSSA